MTTLCGICNEQPKKYKCPTCQLPYCSIPCFKSHKPCHENAPTPASHATPSVPPPLADPTPQSQPVRTNAVPNFSQLSENNEYKELLKSHPTLLSTLRRIYAATLEPDPEDRSSYYNSNRSRGGRGRGGSFRGRGRGGRGGIAPQWTPKQGEKDGMRLLKSIRDGRARDGEKEAVRDFIKMLERSYGSSITGEGQVEEEGVEADAMATD